jgi:hypothetical protein
MHIFLDESGPFVPLGGAKERVSLVGGLVLPTYRLADIYGEYLLLRTSLNFVRGEPKGSAQGEREVAAVVSLLNRHDALLEATCVDAGVHKAGDIEAYQAVQADMIAATPLPVESKYTIQMMAELAHTMRKLPPQLFIQCMLYIDVINRLIFKAPLYYVQREPRELGTFSWVVDGKNEKLTPLEKLWQQIILPMLQKKSETNPMPFLADADYSYFAPFTMLRPHSAAEDADSAGDSLVVNTRALLMDQLRFEDSRDELGLELVDIAVSALARALNGSLGQHGWRDLGKLMIYQHPQSLRFVHFSPNVEEQGVHRMRTTDKAEVIELLQRQGKSMLSDENIRMVLHDRAP